MLGVGGVGWPVIMVKVTLAKIVALLSKTSGSTHKSLQDHPQKKQQVAAEDPKIVILFGTEKWRNKSI